MPFPGVQQVLSQGMQAAWLGLISLCVATYRVLTSSLVSIGKEMVVIFSLSYLDFAQD